MRMIISIIASLLLASMAYSADFTLKSPSFTDKGKIPDLYTCNGKNMAPELKWANPPADTKSFVLILSSSDTPWGMIYLWVLFNIPNVATKLSEGGDNLPEGTVVGENSLQEASYRGPCPPDDKIHHYTFTLYALDNLLDLPDDADVDDVFYKMKYHILKQAQLSGEFSH